MAIVLKRVYDDPANEDGYRVLVDRLWPRGISREQAELNAWLKEAAPSDRLRKWFHQNPSEWGEFRRRYLAELKNQRDTLRPLAEQAAKGRVTLIFGSRDRERNNAAVLKQYLKMLGAPD